MPGSRVLYDGTDRTSDDRVTRALEAAGNDIGAWAKVIHDDRGVMLPVADTEVAQVSALCRMLSEHLTSIGTLEWAGEFVKELDCHEATLRRLTEDVAPGWYAGGCRQEIADSPDGPLLCDSGVYVVPGLTWVTCRACGVTTYARDHLDTILDEARDWVARPKALAEAIVALVDGEHSVPQLHDRIRQWSSRGQVVAYRKADDEGDEVGPKRYRLGDVLDLVLTRAPTKDAKAS